MSQPWIDGARNPPGVGDRVWVVNKCDIDRESHYEISGEGDEWDGFYWLPAPTPPEFVAPEPPLPEVKRCGHYGDNHPISGVLTKQGKNYHWIRCETCLIKAEAPTMRSAIYGWNAMQEAT